MVDLQLLSVKEVASKLGVDRDAVSGYIRNRELAAINVARNRNGRPRWRVSADAIEAFLQSRVRDAKPRSVARPVKKPARTGRQWI